MELTGVRKSIDIIDGDILALLRKRVELVVRAGKLKEHPEDLPREAEVLTHVRQGAKGLTSPEFVEDLYKKIMSESKRQQELSHYLIGFQGEHGAYGETAASMFDGEAVAIPCDDFADVFEEVKTGSLDRGIVPIENSIGGNVTEVEDLLIESGLHVVGEVNVPVHHSLLALPETDYRDIRVVYSHPQALSQCKDFIARNKFEARPYYNTAGAAKMLARERPIGTAVIASDLCGELYGLEVLKENIESNSQNTTRFLVISRGMLPDGGDKCSILFVTKHQPGALYRFLSAFSDAGINLTRIESRPAWGDPGNVAFLLDFQGSDKDRNVATVLEKIKQDCQHFTLLGCYKEWRKGE